MSPLVKLLPLKQTFEIKFIQKSFNIQSQSSFYLNSKTVLKLRTDYFYLLDLFILICVYSFIMRIICIEIEKPAK